MSEFINSSFNINKTGNLKSNSSIKNDNTKATGDFNSLLNKVNNKKAKNNSSLINQEADIEPDIHVMMHVAQHHVVVIKEKEKSTNSKNKTDSKEKKLDKKEKKKLKTNQNLIREVKERKKFLNAKNKKSKNSANSNRANQDEDDNNISDDNEEGFSHVLQKEKKHEEIKKDNQINLQQEDKNQEKEEKDQRKKRNNFYEIEEFDNHISEEDFSSIIKSYGFKENYHNKNIKEIINHLSNENLTKSDSEKISNFISSNLSENNEIHFSDKTIFQRIINEILNHEIDNVYSNILNRFHPESITKIFNSIPDKFLSGIIKKIITKKEKGKSIKSIFKLSNGKKLTFDETEELLEVFEDDLNNNEKEVMKNIFDGYYHKDSQDKIYGLISKLKEKDAMLTGFLETLHELFLDFHANDQKESSKKALSFLEIYQNSNKFSMSDSKILAQFISKKYFDSRNFNQEKIQETLEKIISNNKVQTMYLDLISNFSDKNLLSFMPSNIDLEIRNIFKYSHFMKNEVEYTLNSFNLEVSNKFSFDFFIKVYFFTLKKIDYSSLVIKDEKNNLIKFDINNNQITSIKLEEGKYSIYELYINDQKFNLSNLKIKNNILSFVVNSFTNVFYFGTLEFVLNHEHIKNISLKNEYKEFYDFAKQKESDIFNIKNIKINPKLYS